MPKFNMRDQVNIRRGKVWEKATVTATPAGELPCSYNVIQDGRELRRNRFHLMHTHRRNVDSAVNNISQHHWQQHPRKQRLPDSSLHHAVPFRPTTQRLPPGEEQ